MREALGPDFELLIEAHRRFAPSHAIRIGRRLAEFDIDWFEEPCLADNIELLAEVRRAVPIPIVTGEALYSKEAFFHALERRAADVLNPDVCAMGGIGALLDIAAMAQPQAVIMAPHNFNSTLAGLAATVHVCAVIPNFRITEYFVNFRDVCDEIALDVTHDAGRAGSICRPCRGSASTSTRSSCANGRINSFPTVACAITGRSFRARTTSPAQRTERFTLYPRPKWSTLRLCIPRHGGRRRGRSMGHSQDRVRRRR